MVDTSVSISGLVLDNPIIPASGTFGYGYEYAELFDINCLGSFSFKGTTRETRFGNPTPRIAECPAGMINSVGLQNPGVEKVISEELPNVNSDCFLFATDSNVIAFAAIDRPNTTLKLGTVTSAHQSIELSCCEVLRIWLAIQLLDQILLFGHVFLSCN